MIGEFSKHHSKETQMTVLTGNDNALGQGSWVFTQQGVAADKGFRNVSQFWYPQTKSFDEGIEQVAREAQTREDIKFSPKNLTFHNDGSMTVGIDGRMFKPTEHASRQLCNWLGVPQTMWTHYHGGDADDLAVLNHAFENGRKKISADSPDKELLFRTYQDGTLRAVLSTSYSIVDNQWYLEILKELLPEGRLSHFDFSNADTIYGAVLIPDTLRKESDSDYGGLLDISNCEIGTRTVSQTPSLFRAICMNGCRWGEVGGVEMKKRHRGVILETLRMMIANNVNTQIPLLTNHIDTFLGMRNWKNTSPIENIFASIAKNNQLGYDVVRSFAQEWMTHSKENTAFGVVDAITRGCQQHSADVWDTCNGIAGSILMKGTKGWDSINNVANSMEAKTVAKVFGTAV